MTEARSLEGLARDCRHAWNQRVRLRRLVWPRPGELDLPPAPLPVPYAGALVVGFLACLWLLAPLLDRLTRFDPATIDFITRAVLALILLGLYRAIGGSRRSRVIRHGLLAGTAGHTAAQVVTIPVWLFWTEAATDIEATTPGAITLQVLSTTIGAALTEEIAYRGFLLPALAQRLRHPGVAGLVTAVLFALPHAYGGYRVAALALVLASGYLYGLLYFHTGSIWPGVLAHAVGNALILAGSAAPVVDVATPFVGALIGVTVIFGWIWPYLYPACAHLLLGHRAPTATAATGHIDSPA